MARVQIFALGSEWPELKSNHYLPANFLSWILMKIGECVRLGVMRKSVKGISEEKNFLRSYLSFKIFLSFFYNIYTIFFI